MSVGEYLQQTSNHSLAPSIFASLAGARASKIYFLFKKRRVSLAPMRFCVCCCTGSKKAAVRTINYSAAMWEALFIAKLFKLHNSAEKSRRVSFVRIWQVHKRMWVFTRLGLLVVWGSSFVSAPCHNSKFAQYRWLLLKTSTMMCWNFNTQACVMQQNDFPEKEMPLADEENFHFK